MDASTSNDGATLALDAATSDSVRAANAIVRAYYFVQLIS